MGAFVGSVEFYVIAAFVAAAVIAAVSRPSRRATASTYFYAARLDDCCRPDTGAAIDCRVNERGDMEITRLGIEGVGADGAVSLAVEIIGQDVTIRERMVPGSAHSRPITAASATLDCLGAERYHFQYLSEATKTSTAFYLTIRPGVTVNRPLKA